MSTILDNIQDTITALSKVGTEIYTTTKKAATDYIESIESSVVGQSKKEK